MERKHLIVSACVLLLGTLTESTRAQPLAEPPIPVCMVDGFGAVWDLRVTGTGGGTFSISGSYTIPFHVASVTGTYDRPANELTLTATGKTICDFTYVGSCEPKPGPPLGYCSGTWTNKCFASGTWVGTVTRGACEHPRGQGDRPSPPAASSSATTPEAYALERNTPNPFSGATSISYTVPEATAVRLAVYDVLGRAVATLVDGQVEAGTHLVQFSGADLPAGTYVYRIQAGSFTATEQMMLVK
jgi:hypothetical protein